MCDVCNNYVIMITYVHISYVYIFDEIFSIQDYTRQEYAYQILC